MLRYLSATRVTAVGDQNVDIFDRHLKRLHRDRSAALLPQHDALLGTVTERLLDRLEDVKRTFPVAVALGGPGDLIAQQLAGGRAGVQTLLHVDSSQAMLERSRRRCQEATNGGGEAWPKMHWIAADEEFLPLKENSVDVIISAMGMHWVNDVPGALLQCRRALRPDGLLLVAMLGGDTLSELRISCVVAEQEREGGVSPRVSPLVQVRDAGNLLTRCGLAIPTVDVDDVIMQYPDPAHLVEHLRMLGESSAVKHRRKSLRRDTALAAAATYQTMFGPRQPSESETAEGITATFQVIFMTGWSPDNSQQQPKRRGSATVSFEDLEKALGPPAAA